MPKFAKLLVAFCLTYCFGSSALAGVMTSDVRIVDGGTATAAFAAIGLFDGNDEQNGGATGLSILNGTEGNAFDLELGFDAVWAFIGSTSTGTKISGDVNETSGSLFLNPEVSGPFAISLKAGTQFGFYLFNAQNVSELEFTMQAFQAQNGNIRQLSHAALYIPTNGPPVIVGPQAPEPGALTVFGLLALTCSRIRSRRVS